MGFYGFFKLPGWFFIVPGRFLWVFKVPGSFFHGFKWVFMVFQGFSFVFHGSRWVLRVIHVSRLVFIGTGRLTLKTPQRVLTSSVSWPHDPTRPRRP